jgi:hypothetical protein
MTSISYQEKIPHRHHPNGLLHPLGNKIMTPVYLEFSLRTAYANSEKTPSMIGISIPAWSNIEPHTLSVFCMMYPRARARGKVTAINIL